MSQRRLRIQSVVDLISAISTPRGSCSYSMYVCVTFIVCSWIIRTHSSLCPCLMCSTQTSTHSSLCPYLMYSTQTSTHSSLCPYLMYSTQTSTHSSLCPYLMYSTQTSTYSSLCPYTSCKVHVSDNNVDFGIFFEVLISKTSSIQFYQTFFELDSQLLD